MDANADGLKPANESFDAASSSDRPADDRPTPERQLSYKFQRLRERLRAAITAGELAGKLPGERLLARQFNVNAKTLSKALTDLAAEGVLQRNVGLGTFVRDETGPRVALNTLLLADPAEADSLSRALSARGLAVQAQGPADDLPPSLLSPFDLVLIASAGVPESVVRDLLVRGKCVILVGRQAKPFSTHALLPHATHAAMMAARDLVVRGHRMLALIPDDAADPSLVRAVADAVPQASVRVVALPDLPAAAHDGCTAVVCASKAANDVMTRTESAGIPVPHGMAMIAYGRVAGAPTWCGYFVTDDIVADAVADLASAGLPYQPVTLWLTSENVFKGTAGDRPLEAPLTP